MKWLFLLVTSFVLCSCDLKRGEPIPYSEKEKLADDILAFTALELSNKKNLILCGTGGGMMDQIRMLALSFDYYKPVTIQEGRELLITAVQTLLTEINNNELIRPYLQNYPFQPKNIEICIFLRNANGSPFGEDVLRVIAATEGMLDYMINVPNEDFGYLKTIHEETYEEALRELEWKN